MSTTSILAIILIAVGVLAFGYQGFTYTTRERVVDVGPIKIDADKTHEVPIAPIVGGAALVGGIVLLLLNRKNATAA